MTRPARAFATVLAACAGLGAQAPVFVELEPHAADVWVEQPLEGTLRVGFDAAFFAAQGVPLQAQRLDLPVQLSASWLANGDGHAIEWLEATGDGARRAALGDRVAAFAARRDVVREGRSFAVVELPFRWVPLVAGDGPVDGVQARYAFATSFTEDFLRGRQPIDVQHASVAAPPPQWRVRELPTAGRPPGFAGAVGTFTVRAGLAAAEVEVGGTVAATLVVEGRGNFARMQAPPWPDLDGFAVQGLRERRAGSRAEFVFDLLALREGVETLPPLPFVCFDPTTGGYRTLETVPVPLRVLPCPDVAALPPRVQDLVARQARGGAPWGLLAAAAVAVAVSVLVLRILQRSRRAAARRRQALAALLATAHAGPAAQLAAFETLCAAAAGLAHFDAGGVFATLAARGVGAAASAAQQVHERLEATRFGGPAPPFAAVEAAARDLLGRS